MASGRERPGRRRAWIAGAALLAVLAAAAGAGAWYGSDQSIKVVRHGTSNTRVLAVEDGLVTLEQTPQTAKPGTYWLEWSGAHTMLGDIVSRTPGRITRKVLRGPAPSAGTPGFFGNVPPAIPASPGASATPRSWCPPSSGPRPPGTSPAPAPPGSSPSTGRTAAARPS
ncbi:hypothetical protein ACFQQB_61220 [Nonomuraea rubra]|uniref:hypothetical protein n=1 Tax=Nonomuraea rubra TaxID=46180 RepID=UPI00360B0BCE